MVRDNQTVVEWSAGAELEIVCAQQWRRIGPATGLQAGGKTKRAIHERMNEASPGSAPTDGGKSEVGDEPIGVCRRAFSDPIDHTFQGRGIEAVQETVGHNSVPVTLR